ncbi:hypothetical protein EON65_24980 [archaeon]|nr:MAG: hypothetical protein EON65_24980 [archaeon]
MPTPRPPLEKGNSLHREFFCVSNTAIMFPYYCLISLFPIANGSSWSTRKTDRETIIGDPVHSSPGKHYSKFIAYILRAGIMNKPGVPLYLNLFASFELSGNDLVIEEHSNWDRKLPGTIVHSVLISNTLYENARADSNFRTAVRIFTILPIMTPYLEEHVCMSAAINIWLYRFYFILSSSNYNQCHLYILFIINMCMF